MVFNTKDTILAIPKMATEEDDINRAKCIDRCLTGDGGRECSRFCNNDGECFLKCIENCMRSCGDFEFYYTTSKNHDKIK